MKKASSTGLHATFVIGVAMLSACLGHNLDLGGGQSVGASGASGFPAMAGSFSGGSGTGGGGLRLTDGIAGLGGAAASSGYGGSDATSAGGGVGGAPGSSAGSGGSGGSAVVVVLDHIEQELEGFGISNLFSPPLTAEQAELLFDPVAGIGLSILRIGMDSTGGPMSWSWNSDPWADIGLARMKSPTTIIATVLSAPANCKSNGSENDGGHLLTSCYESWAATIAAFPAIIKAKTGVDLYAISVQNEPDFASCENTGAPCYGSYASMLFTADELVNFTKVVGPKLRAASPTIKITAPDPAEWLHLWSNESAIGSQNPLSGVGYDYGHALARDAEAWALMDIIGTQQYDTEVAVPWPSDVPQSKAVWQTQMSGIEWWPEGTRASGISNGVAVAGWIHDALVNGRASAWLWFRYQNQALDLDDNEGLALKDGTVAKRLYTLGNYSKFIRPGYTRVDVTGSALSSVLLSAFKGPDGAIVVVAINKGDSTATFPISLSGGAPPAVVTPWVTSATEDLIARAPLPVSAASFVATLDSQTVTTFVGQ